MLTPQPYLVNLLWLYLIISETNKNDIRLIDPHFLSQFSTNVTQSFDTVKTHSFESSITKHLGDLQLWFYIKLFHNAYNGLDTQNFFNLLKFKGLTWAYSWPSSLKTSSRLRPSFSFFPLRLFFPPFPLFLGIFNHLLIWYSQIKIINYHWSLYYTVLSDKICFTLRQLLKFRKILRHKQQFLHGQPKQGMLKIADICKKKSRQIKYVLHNELFSLTMQCNTSHKICSNV